MSHNHRIAYVGDGSPDALQAEIVAATPAITEHLQSGNLEVLSTADNYAFRPGTDVLDAEEALTRYLTTVKQALADGYSGFRAVVDVTPVARTPEHGEGRSWTLPPN
ncbi:MAG: hypothetical protein QOF25_1437 [Mycobacterium sp.]|nr:hypothetical protein [Mycobacterium sp.]